MLRLLGIVIFFRQWNKGVLHWLKELPSWQRDIVDFLWIFWGLNWQDRLRVVEWTNLFISHPSHRCESYVLLIHLLVHN